MTADVSKVILVILECMECIIIVRFTQFLLQCFFTGKEFVSVFFALRGKTGTQEE